MFCFSKIDGSVLDAKVSLFSQFCRFPFDVSPLLVDSSEKNNMIHPQVPFLHFLKHTYTEGDAHASASLPLLSS